MHTSASIAQGLKQQDEVENLTLSETIDKESSFKFFTVKQIFPKNRYCLQVHQDAVYQQKPPFMEGFGDWKPPASYSIPHKTVTDTNKLARPVAIDASISDSMMATVMAMFGPKEELPKLLREQLLIIREAQVGAVSAAFAAASKLQLFHRDVLLKNFNFLPMAFSAAHMAPFHGAHVLGPEPIGCLVVLSSSLSHRLWRRHLRLLPWRHKPKSPSLWTSPPSPSHVLPCLTGWDLWRVSRDRTKLQSLTSAFGDEPGKRTML